jgi:predicted HicB family RNase H-like nuclease
MKKPVTMRIDPELLSKAQEAARRDNRSLTNLVETILRRHVENIDESSGGGVHSQGQRA